MSSAPQVLSPKTTETTTTTSPTTTIDDRFAADMRGDVVVDARNLFDPTAVAATGLRYIGVGR